MILIAICLMISACASQGTSATSLIGSWKLTAYGSADAPTPATADREANLTFEEDGSVSGNSGCNSFGGTYTIKGDQVTFSQLISTLMACGDPVMEQEGAIYQVLTDTASFKIEGNTLTLTKDDIVLVLTR